MRVDAAVKFIIVLLVIMIVSLATALIILNNDDGEKETTPAVTTKAPSTTKPDTTAPETTTSGETTTPEVTTTPEITTTPNVTTTPGTTTEPDVTEPDVVPPSPDVPNGLSVEKSFRSNTGVSLNIRADVKAYEKDGKAYVRVDVYLEHYSITIKARNGVITVGNKEITFKTDALNVSLDEKTETLLATKEIEVEYGESVKVKVDLESNVTYAGKKLDRIVAEGTVTVK